MATNHLQKALSKSKSLIFWHNNSSLSEAGASSADKWPAKYSKKLGKVAVKLSKGMRAGSSKKLWKDLVSSASRTVAASSPAFSASRQESKKIEELLVNEINKLEELMKTVEEIAASVLKHSENCRGCPCKHSSEKEQNEEDECFYDSSECF